MERLSPIKDRPRRQRLDQALVDAGHFATRSRARDAILRGCVQVDGAMVNKPAATLPSGAAIVIDDPAAAYVSRAALKLIAGLDTFSLDPSGRNALDIGASTGGFTQVLIERGASHVVAVDVGHGQMDKDLAADARVTAIEGLNARELAAQHLGGRRIGCIVSDVSFISLRLALPPALALAAPGAFCVLLVKPQFEAGRAAIGKGGLLRDTDEAARIADALARWLACEPGWSVLGTTPAPITGSDGNREYLLCGVKQ